MKRQWSDDAVIQEIIESVRPAYEAHALETYPELCMERCGDSYTDKLTQGLWCFYLDGVKWTLHLLEEYHLHA